MKTITIIPPSISQYFDRKLLSRPAPKFYDDSERLWFMYQWIKNNLRKKTQKNLIRNKKFLELESKFLEFYGRTVAKEKDIQEKTGKPFVLPFYRIEYADKRKRKLFERFRRRAH